MVQGSARSIRSHSSLSLALLLGAWFTFLPSKTVKIDARGVAKRALIISVPRLSPAFAAIEDAFKDWTPADDNNRISPTKRDAEISLEPSASYKVIPARTAITMQVLAQIPLGGKLKLAVPKAAPAPAARPAPAKVVASAPVVLKGLTIRTPQAPVALVADADDSRLKGMAVGRHQDLVREFANVDLTQPTIESRLRKLVEKELAERKTENTGSRFLPSTMGGGVLVATHAGGTTDAIPPSSTTPPPARRPEEKMATAHGTAPAGPAPAAISWAPAESDATTAGQTQLIGQLVMTGGLAYTGLDELVIYRESGGLRLERGKVWLEEGRFELAAKKMNGYLVAELRTQSGEVLGRGEINLRQIATQASSPKVDGLRLSLKPVVNGAKVSVVSAYSYGDEELPVKGAQVVVEPEKAVLSADAEGKVFVESGFLRGSSFVARATAKNHWGTLAIGLGSEEARIRLFPNKMMDALLNLTLGEDRKLASHAAVIWGRVVKDGKPVAGARVEMAGDHRQQPIYFSNLMLPDRYAESTSENGMFAFVWVTPGIQSVRVQYQDAMVPAQFLPAEAGHVSFMEFAVGDMDSSVLELADPFDTGRQLIGAVRLAADDTNLAEIQGRGSLRFAHGPGLMMLDADAGEPYEIGRLTVSRQAKQILFPMVRRDWLQSIASRKRINIGAGVGAVVGFVGDDDFIVRMAKPEDRDNVYQPEVVYFNARGDVLFGEEGVAGGGFAIFNVSPGLRTVTIAPKSRGKIMTQVLVSEPGVVNIVRPTSLD